MRKVCLIGPSGTGKTELAQYISLRYRIPFISGSLKNLALTHNDDMTHSDIIKLCCTHPKDGLEIYRKLLKMRLSTIYENSEFVTDRGIPDLIVYSTLQLIPHLEPDDASDFTEELIELLKHNSDVTYIFLPYNNDHSIDNNYHRVLSTTYQNLISSCFRDVAKGYIPKGNLLVINDWDWDTRVNIIDTVFEIDPYDIDTLIERLKVWLRRITKKQ